MPSASSPVALRGITWNHTRGYLPMVATAQRFSERNPDVTIAWEKRSLQQFADAPLSELTSRFDLLVIDHPSIGEAAHHQLLLKLDEHLSPGVLADQERHSVGGSHASYCYEGHQYALAIDAATPIAGWRADLLEHASVDLPRTWDDLLALARQHLVLVPALAIDSLMNLFMLANALGGEPFTTPGEAIPHTAGAEALVMLRELVRLCGPDSLTRNPIRTWQTLAESTTAAYSPFAYGYSNYSRRGYAPDILTTGGLITLNGKPLRSTLGGAGLAISASCQHLPEALHYVQTTASAELQATLYTESGGQPGHRAAWLDPALNRLTNDFFRNTLPTLDEAWIRPRFPGFIAFQDRASELVHEYLRGTGRESDVLAAIDHAYGAAGKGTA